ncbi:MAG: hypothetical protein QW806_09160 [Nitrososphaerota archaeon]
MTVDKSKKQEIGIYRKKLKDIDNSKIEYVVEYIFGKRDYRYSDEFSEFTSKLTKILVNTQYNYLVLRNLLYPYVLCRDKLFSGDDISGQYYKFFENLMNKNPYLLSYYISKRNSNKFGSYSDFIKDTKYRLEIIADVDDKTGKLHYSFTTTIFYVVVGQLIDLSELYFPTFIHFISYLYKIRKRYEEGYRKRYGKYEVLPIHYSIPIGQMYLDREVYLRIIGNIVKRYVDHVQEVLER